MITKWVQVQLDKANLKEEWLKLEQLHTAMMNMKMQPGFKEVDDQVEGLSTMMKILEIWIQMQKLTIKLKKTFGIKQKEKVQEVSLIPSIMKKLKRCMKKKFLMNLMISLISMTMITMTLQEMTLWEQI